MGANFEAPLYGIFSYYCYFTGARGIVVVKALCYKPESRGFDTRWGDFLIFLRPSDNTRSWGLLSL
jgi:hypothetical protein